MARVLRVRFSIALAVLAFGFSLVFASSAFAVEQGGAGATALNVHFYGEPEITMAQGRHYASFHNGAKSVSVPTDFAWTAQLEMNELSDDIDLEALEVRGFRAEFSDEIPAGAVMTLSVMGADGSYTRYFKVLMEDSASVELLDFVSLANGGETYAYSEDDVLFLLSVDFKDSDASAMADVDVTFSMDFHEFLDDETVSYRMYDSGSFNLVDMASVTADEDGVTIVKQPVALDERSGQKVYLVAVVEGDGAGVNMSATLASVGGVEGVWLDGETVAFELGDYGSLDRLVGASQPYSLNFDGQDANVYDVTWKLCYGEHVRDCILENVVSDAATVRLSRPETRPYLSIEAVGDDTSDRLYRLGEDSDELTIDVDTNRDFRVCVQKQVGLGRFDTVVEDVAYDMDVGSVVVGVPQAKGTYRVVFSIDGASRSDDVYYSFVTR